MPNIALKAIAAGLYNCELKLANGTIIPIPAIKSLSSTADSTVTEIEGGDKKRGSFTFTMAEQVDLQMDGVELDTLAALTGNSYAVSSSSRYSLNMGTLGQVNPPFFQITGYTRARDVNGVKAEMRRVLYKCQIQGVPDYSEEYQAAFSAKVTIKAYPTTQDITGAALSEECISNIELRSVA